MNIHEYQAKELLKAYGIPVPVGGVAYSDRQAAQIAEDIGGSSWVVKAQIHAGGRGKAGGVKLASTPDDAFTVASAILGMDIKGHTVHRVLVAEARDIAEEYYFSFLLDRSNRTFLAMAISHGCDSAIVDVLDDALVDIVATAEMLMNKQIYSDSFIRAYRSTSGGQR